MADVVANFIQLFRGRADVYGSWEGSCIKQQLTQVTFRQHLTEGPHIGVYPAFNVNGQAHCVWGCSDIDYVYDDMTEALALHDTFAAVGAQAWMEKTNKGWHVWVFPEGLAPADHVRRMFLAAHQVAKVKPREVNPKQTVLAEGQVGNYVRLPYPGGLLKPTVYGPRTIIHTDGLPLSIEEFTQQAIGTRVPIARVAELAEYYVEPVRPSIEMQPPSLDMLEASRRLTPLGKVIFRDGPLEGRDRSTTLQHLAFECFKAALDPSDALLLIQDAESRWGQAKYSSRGEAGENLILDLVWRAYENIPST